MSEFVGSCLLALMLLVGGAHTTPAAAAQPLQPGSLNFKLMYRAAQLANEAYDKRAKILRAYKRGEVWVNTPGRTNVQYILLTDRKRQRQIIAVRGTVDDVNWKLDQDRRGVKDRRAGILLHRGFRLAADNIYADVKPRLNPNYTTYLTGHSLGGAVAAIVGIYAADEGFKLGGILTFGQPKFTNLQGAKTYRDLPILRVVYQNDTVSLLPYETQGTKQRFVHVGPVLNLYSGPYYAYGTIEQSIWFDLYGIRGVLAQISLPDHKMKWYLQGLRDKAREARRVRFEDRNRYIVRHKYGAGKDTVLPKKTYNFNHHD